MDAATGTFTNTAAEGGLTRLVSADAKAALEQLKSSEMLADGRVCLIGLDAIRQSMGARWPARREMVHDHIQRTLQRQVGAHGFYLRISETDYLVAQPAVSRLAGQAYCLNCLREILQHFLGEALVANIVVHEVTEIGDGEVSGRRLDAIQVQAAEAAERASGPPAAAPTPSARIAPQLISQDRWTPFVANDGRSLRASSRLEPVLQLGGFRRIGYRLTRRVLTIPDEKPLTSAETRQLSSSDIERIDFATLARGLNRLDAETARQPSLILPVSFVTLSSHRGRATLAEFFRAARGTVKQGLICEVCDVEGVPPSALLAATSLIRPFCLFVVGRLAEAPAASLGHLKDAGLQGFSIERPPELTGDLEFATFAKTVMAAAKAVTKTVLIYRLAGPRQAAIAAALGATHASIAAASGGQAESLAAA